MIRCSIRGGVLALTALVTWAGAATAQPSPVEVLPAGVMLIDPPAKLGSSNPAIASEGATTVTKDHEVLMTWLAPAEGGSNLMFSRFSEEGWSQPITVADQVSTLGSSDRPTLTVIDTQAVRRTLIARTGDVVARSPNAGRTWSRLPAPTLPFASFAGGDEGAYAFWLKADGDDRATLFGSRVMVGGTVLDEEVVGGAGTAAAMTWDGPVVVYRDRSAEGGEEIAVIRRQDARWTEPGSVHAERWRPSNSSASSPMAAADRRRVAVAWYTEAPPRPRVLVAFSNDAARTFDIPIEVDGRDREHVPMGAVDVAVGDGGDALVLWMAADGPDVSTLNLVRVASDGRRGEVMVLARGLHGDIEGHPQITRADDRVAVTWVEGSPGRVRAAAVPLVAIPEARGQGPRTADSNAEPPPRYAGRGRVGELMPDPELVSLAGDAVSLSALRGHPVLLNLWATWCLPCLAEMPELAALHERYKDDGLAVVGLSVDDAGATERVHRFVEERSLPFTVWLDPEMRILDSLRVRALPTTFLVDGEGEILWRRDQPITADDPLLERALDRALGHSD
jgi:thiol-disulfide isomerase/thioredoxin